MIFQDVLRPRLGRPRVTRGATGSAAIRARSALAGSSAGSCGTRRPSNAALRMDCLSRAASAASASRMVSVSEAAESASETRRQISAASVGGERAMGRYEQTANDLQLAGRPFRCGVEQPCEWERAPNVASRLCRSQSRDNALVIFFVPDRPTGMKDRPNPHLRQAYRSVELS